jgi:biopolymer transport protein ExbD
MVEMPVFLAVDRDGLLRLDGREVRPDEMVSEIHRVFSARAGKVLFIEGDRDLEYRRIAELIDLVIGVDPAIQVGLAHS